MLRAIKRFAKVVRMRFCRHEFILIDSEYNNVSKQMGCGRLWYRCPKCGKMFHTELRWKGSDSYAKGCFAGIKKRSKRSH